MANLISVRRERLTVIQNLSAAPADIWRLIAAGSEVERWFPWVAATLVLDPSEGGLRRIELKDGAVFAEYITLNDEPSMTYQYYAPEPPLPIQHVIGTQRVAPRAGGGALLSWFVTFDVLPAAPPEIVSTMRELYQSALGRIEHAALGSVRA